MQNEEQHLMISIYSPCFYIRLLVLMTGTHHFFFVFHTISALLREIRTLEYCKKTFLGVDLSKSIPCKSGNDTQKRPFSDTNREKSNSDKRPRFERSNRSENVPHRHENTSTEKINIKPPLT